MENEKEIQETEVEYLALPDINEKPKRNWQKKLKKISGETWMLLIVGILLGMVVKTEAAKRINVADGNIYAKQSFDFVQIEKDLVAKGSSTGGVGINTGGGSCGQ
jgi:hypothetical protein